MDDNDYADVDLDADVDVDCDCDVDVEVADVVLGFIHLLFMRMTTMMMTMGIMMLMRTG